MEPCESRIGVNDKALQKSLPDMYRQFVGGESRFLYACLSRKFDPSIVIVAESSFTIMAVYKALKRRSDFRGHAKTSSEGIDLLVRSRPGIACIVEAGSECRYGDVIDFVSTSCPTVRSILILSKLEALDHSHASQADVIVADEDIFLPVNPVFQGLMALIAGTVYRSPSIVRYLEASTVARDSPPSDRIVLGLRDQQLLEAYVLGLSNREVAEHLNLSVRTVQTYSGQLLQRLGVNNRQKAILRAIEIGISFVPKYFKRISASSSRLEA
jgi:DNA-binding NarL/FixJ family response regulator